MTDDSSRSRPPAAVLVVGEALVDLLPAGEDHDGGSMPLLARFGGSPANVAVGLARLDITVGFAARLSSRGYGPWLRAHLEAEGVDLRPSVAAAEPCSLAVVTLDTAGVASYEFYGPDTADWAWRHGELPDPATLAGRAVHTGSLATGLAPGAAVIVDWLRALRARGDVAISYDPNIRPSLLGDADLPDGVVAPALACAHLVKVSDEDLEALYPGVTVKDVVAGWLARTSDRSDAAVPTDGPHLVVVTSGSDGATAWHRDGRVVHRAAPTVTVVDTVGAGDAFSAALLSYLHDHDLLTPRGLGGIGDTDISAALDCANRSAGLTCMRPGADPPRRAELI